MDFKNRNQQFILFCCLTLIGIKCNAQIETLGPEWSGKSNILEFDSTRFRTDTISIGIPDILYLETITQMQDGEIVDRCPSAYRYVFPAKVNYNDSCYLITFTAAGLYATGYHETMSIYDFQQWLFFLCKDWTLSCLKRFLCDLWEVPTISLANLTMWSLLISEEVDGLS